MMEKPTLKEYKAMMEGATDAPWIVDIMDDIFIKSDRGGVCEIPANGCYKYDKWENDAKFIAASRNIAPSLIRVIELAEELTLEIQQKHHIDFDKVSYLREEIRKLRGE